jgi:glutaconyl-CoA/methylmalonyl-CoA decarboxylase subunit gamma
MWMKKKYIMHIAGEQITAILARDGDRVAIQIDDGELREIDAETLHGGGAISLRSEGHMHLVDLTHREAPGAVAASVDGRAVDLTVMDELRAMALESRSGAGGDGAVNAEIPGLVVEILVAPGQSVATGDTLLVLEAMKMQNEITAPIDGTVGDVLVETGQSVNAGDGLLRIEEAE